MSKSPVIFDLFEFHVSDLSGHGMDPSPQWACAVQKRSFTSCGSTREATFSQMCTEGINEQQINQNIEILVHKMISDICRCHQMN